MDSSQSSNTSASSANVAVLVLMGLPGSGKTTLCLSLPHFLGSQYHIIHICYDQVIPFKEDMSWEEKQGSWKAERAKVVQATETLVCNLIDANSNGNEKCANKKQKFQDKHNLIPSINCRFFDKDLSFKNIGGEVISVNKSTASHTKSKQEEARNSNQNMDSSLECVVISNRGHYTMLNSFNDIVSMHNKISECDLQNELFVICVDDNCYYRSMRKEWWNLAAKYELPFGIVTLKCEVEVCLRRVRERLHSSTFHNIYVPETVIARMNKHLEFPDGDLYPWEKHSIVIDSNSLNILVDATSTSPLLSNIELTIDRYSFESINRIKQLVNSSLLEPAKCLNMDTHSCTNSVTSSIIHKADLVLRKIVGKSDPTIRAQVNMKRKNILEDLRNGKLSIPCDSQGRPKDGFEHEFDEYMATLINVHY